MAVTIPRLIPGFASENRCGLAELLTDPRLYPRVERDILRHLPPGQPPQPSPFALSAPFCFSETHLLQDR